MCCSNQHQKDVARESKHKVFFRKTKLTQIPTANKICFYRFFGSARKSFSADLFLLTVWTTLTLYDILTFALKKYQLISYQACDSPPIDVCRRELRAEPKKQQQQLPMYTAILTRLRDRLFVGTFVVYNQSINDSSKLCRAPT